MALTLGERYRHLKTCKDDFYNMLHGKCSNSSLQLTSHHIFSQLALFIQELFQMSLKNIRKKEHYIKFIDGLSLFIFCGFRVNLMQPNFDWMQRARSGIVMECWVHIKALTSCLISKSQASSSTFSY